VCPEPAVNEPLAVIRSTVNVGRKSPSGDTVVDSMDALFGLLASAADCLRILCMNICTRAKDVFEFFVVCIPGDDLGICAFKVCIDDDMVRVRDENLAEVGEGDSTSNHWYSSLNIQPSFDRLLLPFLLY